MKNIRCYCLMLLRHFITHSVLLMGLSSTSFAFEVGGRIEPRNDSRWHLEAVTQEYNRSLETLTPGDDDSLKFNEVDPLVNKVNINILSLRPSVYIGERLSLFVELGLYNDLETTSSSPFFAGVGGNFVLGKVGPLKIVPFGSIRRTQTYQYEFEVTTLPLSEFSYVAHFKSHFTYYAAGLMFASELALAENKEIFPYFGVEYSLHRSSLINSIQFVSLEQGEFFIEDKIRVESVDNILFVLGGTLVRKKFATIRIETRFRKSNLSWSLNFGFFL